MPFVFPQTLVDFLDVSPVGVFALNGEGTIVYVNPKQCEISRLTRDELVGQNYRAFFYNTLESQNLLATFDRLHQDGVTFEITVPDYRRHADGAVLALGVKGYQYAGYTVILTTIEKALQLERTRLTDALRENEKRYRNLFENAGDAILTFTLDGVITAVNRGLEAMTGWSREELVGQHYGKITTPTARRLGQEYTRRVLAGDKLPPIFEAELLGKDGRVTPIECRTRLIRNQEGKPVGIQGIYRDITERKRMEAALRESEERYRWLIDNTLDIITVLNADGSVAYSSPAVERLLGYEPREGGVRHFLEHLHPDEAPSLVAAFAQAIQQKDEIGSIQFRVRRSDGAWLVLEAVGKVLRTQSGEVKILVSSRDITERKQIEKELARAKETAESANRAKSEFLANMSHEIRTPMNGVIGMTELLLDTELTPEQREYAGTVRSSAETLLGVLNDILDFSKIEAGKLDLEQVDFSLRESLGDVMKTLALRAHQKGLELLYDVKPDVPDGLRGDPTRFRQVIVNLVGNAVKFTERGEVSVEVRCEEAGEESPDKCVVHVKVRDTGIGVPPDKQRLIFEAFSQADASTTRHYGGTGLGLAISRQLVALMEGKMWVESAVGQGSTFHFTVRLERSQTLVAPALVLPTQLQGLRVLVVDDNATNRCILYDLLSAWQMQPVLASSAQEALVLLHEACARGHAFPLILTDAHMPEMDGFTLVERIKHEPQLAGAAIMMLTSSDQKGEKVRCRELGISVYLIKPVRPSELLRAIRKALGQEGTATAQQEHAALPQKRQRPLHILLAEDNAVNQKLAVRLLEKQGHTVVVVGDGRKALAALTSDHFDVVLMDVQMPEMDGFEATALIRTQERTARTHLPIIAMTAHAMKGDRERCLAAGMDDYVSKPLKARDLFAALERVMTAAIHPLDAPLSLADPVDDKIADSGAL